MRLINADALKIDYYIVSTATNMPIYYYVSKEQIDSAPAIEAEPVKQGRWKRTKAYPDLVFCDECGEPFKNNPNEEWNYCPNCGARMI